MILMLDFFFLLSNSLHVITSCQFGINAWHIRWVCYIYRYIRANRCFVSDIDAAEIQLASNVLTLLTGCYKERIFLFRHQIVINQVFQGFLFLLETLTPFFKKLYRSMRRQKSSGFQPSVVRFEQENTLKTRVGICSNCFPSSRRQLYAFLITHVTHNALGTKHLFLFHCLFKELDRLLG